MAGAGIVLTATPSQQPLVTGADLAAGAMLLAMGADTRGKRELGEGALDGADLVADVPDQAAVVGELAYLPGGPDPARCIALGELLAGQRSLPERSLSPAAGGSSSTRSARPRWTRPRSRSSWMPPSVRGWARWWTSPAEPRVA